MEWTYISDKKPEENHDYWVSCIIWAIAELLASALLIMKKEYGALVTT